jgi:hypothetical protein
MSNKSNTSSGGVGVLGLLGILFVGLKLTNFIDWAWVWVLAPFWGSIALIFVIIMLAGIFVILDDLYRRVKKKLKK